MALQRNLNDYIRDARERTGTPSNRKLSTMIAGNEKIIQNWTRGAAWPSDEAMIRLAELAGHDPARALLDLHAWKASAEVRPIYESIIAKLVAAFLLAAIFAPSPSQSATSAAARYTLCDIWRRIRRALGNHPTELSNVYSRT